MMNNQYTKILLLSLGFLVFSNGQAQSSKFEVDPNSLHQAVWAQNVEQVKMLVLTGSNPNQLGPSWYDYGSPLHIAAREGNSEIAMLLIEHGAIVDLRDQSDHTPLHNAAWNGNLDMVKLLIDAGADIGATTYTGATPLSCARSGYKNKVTDVARYLEEKLQLRSN